MTINTKLNFVEYESIVDSIAYGYFDFNGEYTPGVGYANVIRLFYDICVTDSKFDSTLPHDFTEITLVDTLESDDEFMEAFENALKVDAHRFDFGNAYRDALDIVRSRRDSLGENLKRIISLIANMLRETMTPDNIDITKKIAEDISSGKIDFSKIMAAYGGSPEFKQAVSSEATEDNIIPMKPKTE